MDTSARHEERSALAAETRLSALLILGALGSIGAIALVLFLLTSGLAG